MSEQKALIAAIRETPDDDAPRLIYADWLEEKGGDANVERAAFIRTQIERATLPEHDPRQIELEARELQLLRQFAKAWCGSHFLFKKSRFRRGFIEYVHVNLQHFLHHRRQFFDLEPVRDVSLTGWMRANDDLVRRVAGCEEWRFVETLRIHHQGPHKSPRSNVVTLIESPHLTRMKSLRVPMLAINADARRRFENAPMLTRLTELSLPHLDTYPDDAGHWLSDGLPAKPWTNLLSLRLTDYVMRMELLEQLTTAPFWKQLQSLSMILPYHQTANSLALLRDRLPPSLESVRVVAQHGPVELGDGDAFFARLAELPLSRLELQDVPISATALRNLLDENSACRLRDLSLQQCGLTDVHIDMIATLPGSRWIEKLHLSEYQGYLTSAKTFYASENLTSLTSLNLAIPSFGPSITEWLAKTTDWQYLRSLTVTGRGIQPKNLARLLRSPISSGLVRLEVGFDDLQGSPDWYELFELLNELPNLARLHVIVNETDEELSGQIARLKRRIWATVQCHNSPTEYEIDCYDLPPLDVDLESINQT